MDLIRVGSFELYPSERLLRAGSKPVELGARAFDLLLVLVEHPGRLVSKATLIERVWPRLVVDENNLPAQIASLRRVLGAGAIRTVPGFGYRLELEVSHGARTPSAPAAASGTPDPPRLTVPRRAWPDRLVPLIGRDADVRSLQHALGRSSLVTVVGTAGVGKTRLAQEILVRESERPDLAVAWVELAPIEETSRVPSAIALALGLSPPEGPDGFAALSLALESLSVLLILDCAERLADELATPLSELISRTRRVRALVTSQRPLGASGEAVYRLAALPVPQPATPPPDAAQYAAVALFAQRAAAADQRFELNAQNTPLVAEICRRLDGIPLALELAAARVPALGAATLLERLDDRFRLLRLAGRPADSRHGALHAALDWSYELLTRAEQKVLNRLGAFAGSFSLKAAASCVADSSTDASEAIDLIGRLVDRSLVTALAVEPPRYVLLESTREYALAKLAASGELEAARERMAATTLDVLDLAYHEYWSLDEAIWFHRFGPELDNVRAALEWATRGNPALAIALLGSAWPLFVETDLHGEARARHPQLLGLLSDQLPRHRVGRYWEAVATFESGRRYDRARYAAELAAGMHEEAGNASARYYALLLLALNERTDTAAARAVLETARGLENPAWAARLLAHGALTEGALLMHAGEIPEARAAYQRGVRLALTTSERQALAATVHLVELDVVSGNTDAALQLGRPLAVSVRHLGRRDTRFELLTLIFSALLLAGDLEEARAAGAELYDLAERLDASKLHTALDAMALLACREGRHAAAARIAGCADAAREARGQAIRRPCEERVRAEVIRAIAGHLGPEWRTVGAGAREPLNELGACALALGRSP